ncbi:MAG: sigma 54-interacting transcriptional regulator [Deltaproteobacteria bacterium]|nr:sigma 54-interacting transcriptional regulator [Deltaproteobacteria bacterium]
MANSKDIRQEIKGRSKNLLVAICRLERVAPTKLPVLIRGETGSGKEMAARLVHDRSGRRSAPYKPINCAAIPETLLESMLFGHKRGAFTGALDNRRGVFEAANGGTVFLDEIGEMSLLLQAKVLRVLEEGTVQPVGSDEVRAVDVRVVAASHRDLKAMVENNTFRLDLYHRLKVYAVDLPPLRERGRDIVDLARHFLQRLCPSKRLGRKAEAILLAHSWPGNIRELRNVIEAASVDAGRTLQPKHILFHLDSEVDQAGADEPCRTDLIMGVVDRLGTAAPGEIRAETSISRTTLLRALNDLVAAGVLGRTGDGRDTRYARADARQSGDAITARQRLILRHVEDAGRITRQQAAETSGTAIRTASRDLARLVELGRLVPDGQTGNAAGYVLP